MSSPLWPMDCSPSGSSVHGIFQARLLEWVAISFSRGSSWPRDWTQVSCIAGRFFTTERPGKLFIVNAYGESEAAQSCLTLCDPMDCSLPDSSVHGISQEKILEWVASSFSKGSSWPRDWTQVSWIAGRFFAIWVTGEANTEISAMASCRKNS